MMHLVFWLVAVPLGFLLLRFRDAVFMVCAWLLWFHPENTLAMFVVGVCMLWAMVYYMFWGSVWAAARTTRAVRRSLRKSG